MSLKGDKTKQDIREKAYQLFSEKGFKDVTMKDICELTGLSRGGLSEMIDYKNSISLAIYEFYSNPAVSKENNSVKKQYEISKSIWIELINYGIDTKEFNSVNPESIFNVIIFAYQRVRMYSRLMKMDNNIPTQIINEIKRLLLPEEVQHEK